MQGTLHIYHSYTCSPLDVWLLEFVHLEQNVGLWLWGNIWDETVGVWDISRYLRLLKSSGVCLALSRCLHFCLCPSWYDSLLGQSGCDGNLSSYRMYWSPTLILWSLGRNRYFHSFSGTGQKWGIWVIVQSFLSLSADYKGHEQKWRHKPCRWLRLARLNLHWMVIPTKAQTASRYTATPLSKRLKAQAAWYVTMLGFLQSFTVAA